MSEVQKATTEAVQDSGKIGDVSANWQMDISEFTQNGCLINGN